jgi:hypothetical protein
LPGAALPLGMRTTLAVDATDDQGRVTTLARVLVFRR